MRRGFIVAAVLIALQCVTVNGLMIEIPYEQLWEKSDTVVLGTVTGITHHGTSTGNIYRIVKISVESFYKNPLDAETLFIRVEGGELGDRGMWVEDQPEFQMGEEIIVFLQLSDLTYLEEPIYRVYGGFQGKFHVVGDAAYGVYTLKISEEDLKYVPLGPLEVVELLIPENRTVYEVITGRIGLFNPGRHDFSGNFSLIFRGVSGACNGSSYIYSHFAHITPRGYIYGEIELNFTRPGVYDVFLWDDPVGSVRIHEAGYMNNEFEFGYLRVTPSEAVVGQPVNITFTIKSNRRVPSECLFWLKVRALEGEYEGCLTVPMSVTVEPGEDALGWYAFGTSEPGRFLAAVWFRGEKVLEGSLTLRESTIVDVDGVEENQMKYILPFIFLAGLVLLLAYAMRRLMQ